MFVFIVCVDCFNLKEEKLTKNEWFIDVDLRATACKYEESSDRTKILDFFLFHPKNPFGELLSKIVLKSSIALLFLRKIEKLKISDGRRLTPRKMM